MMGLCVLILIIVMMVKVIRRIGLRRLLCLLRVVCILRLVLVVMDRILGELFLNVLVLRRVMNRVRILKCIFKDGIRFVWVVYGVKVSNGLWILFIRLMLQFGLFEL